MIICLYNLRLCQRMVQYILQAELEIHPSCASISFVKSDRIELKKFQDHKGPLNMLKIKMQMKANDNPGYQVFADELVAITKEQDKCLEDLDWKIATAEATDKVQEMFFIQNMSSCPGLGSRLHGCSLNVTDDAQISYMGVAVCVHLYTFIRASSRNKANNLQTSDEDFDKISEGLLTKGNLLVHHLSGAAAARKRFAAMLGMTV